MSNAREGKTRTVNLDEWLARKHPPGVSASVKMPTEEEIAEARRSQTELAKLFLQQSREREREPLLDGAARECPDCGKTERAYAGDYICYTCRDALESEDKNPDDTPGTS